MSKRAKIITAVAVLLAVAGVAAFVAFGSRGAGPQIETATAQEQPLAVTVTASGRVDKGVSADVFPPAAGTIDSIEVSEGATVTAGDTIAQMDTAPFELQVAQARAGLSQAKAQRAAIGQQAPSQADIDAARAQVAAAERAYTQARNQAAALRNQGPNPAQVAAAQAATQAARSAYEQALAAYEALAAASPNPSTDATVAVAAAVRDQAYAQYLGARAQEQALGQTNTAATLAQAQAGVDQAFAAVQGARAQLDRLTSTDTAAQRAAADAAIAQAAEALSLAERNLEQATLVAPIDGIVIFNSAGGGAAAAAAAAAGAGGAATGGGGDGKPSVGSGVAPGSAPFTVVDLDALNFSAEVDEGDISRVRVGMSAEIALDAFPGERFKTKVARINPAAQPTATGGTVFVVEFALSNTSRDVLLGMRGDADIEVSSVGSAVTIPVEALFSEGGTDYVYVVEDGRLRRTDITVGATTDTDVEVLEGLSAGDTVALSGSVQYTDGMAVRVE